MGLMVSHSQMASLKNLFASPARLFWLLQAAGWLGYFSLHYLSAVGHGKPWEYAWVSAAATLIGFFVTALLRLGYRSVWALSTGRMIAASAVLLVLATAVYSTTYAEAVFRWCFECRPESLLGYIGYFGSALYVMLSWSGLYFGIKFSREIAHERESALRANATAHEAQLKMLRYQLNPHFLFNTLNSISTLVLLRQTERANAMLSRLSSFLRYTLVNEPTAKVTLVQEVETLKLYLEIEKMRFEDRLRPHFKIDGDTIGARLPSLLLQPLIENAIKYAVTPAEHGADIWITAQREGRAVRIEVADSGPGPGGTPVDAQSTGVGLANIQDRLAQAYGPAHGFSTRANEHGGFSVIIEIPLETDQKDHS